mmetsp:Transcript_15468/g.31067  ORF Transcript_15468/g.31067 Transcript_15468/m.31067 type:complete len:198 (-) Transcript_15468:1134-1727(-)
MLGEIVALLASLDRQASLVDEKMDGVKEYLLWREVPHKLRARVRRFYEHYYTKVAIFDEESILNGLSPGLHQEVVLHILSSIGAKLRIFQKFDSDFMLTIFPHLKPVSYVKNEIIFRRGQTSKNMYFLIQGEIDVCSTHDENVPIYRIRPHEEVRLQGESDGGIKKDTLSFFGQVCGHSCRPNAGQPSLSHSLSKQK